ncbi:MAG: trehalose-6-phosphate synthase [bacterium]|nr:trehalose-6-phosphate synthase [bacterium]
MAVRYPAMTQVAKKRLVVVSNRLPVALDKNQSGLLEVKQGTGGLVTALEPIVRKSNGIWIGWPGCMVTPDVKEALTKFTLETPHTLIPIDISEEEVQQYYRGYSNKTIWPLFHDLLGQFSFDLENYDAYQKVNHRFASVVAQSSMPDDACWIHDYQLIFAGQYLRELSYHGHLDYFLHIPFPSLDLFRRLPRYEEIMHAFLAYDHIGFQTSADRRNFIGCVKWMVPKARVTSRKRQATVQYEGRDVIVGYYPISIDFEEFSRGADSSDANDAAWFLRENLTIKHLALGLDRLDYTKGIRERFLAFERLLVKHPELVGDISLLQIVIPSRLNVPEYQELKRELDFEAGRINSTFSQHGWVPILYEFRTLNREQLLGHYKAADIALITPIRDGMNLVSKEFCASCTDEDGVLILSRFAGASAQLGKNALLVNPFDYDEIADAIYRACTMSADEKQNRMRTLRSEIRRNNVHRWVRWFFKEESPDVQVGPVIEQNTTDGKTGKL